MASPPRVLGFPPCLVWSPASYAAVGQRSTVRPEAAVGVRPPHPDLPPRRGEGDSKEAVATPRRAPPGGGRVSKGPSKAPPWGRGARPGHGGGGEAPHP